MTPGPGDHFNCVRIPADSNRGANTLLTTEIEDEPSDNSYLRNPPMGGILHAREVPSRGGDTLWSNQYLAYDTLPSEIIKEIEGLIAIHSPDKVFGGMRPLADRDKSSAIEVEHPLVRTHPETGRKSLFVSGACTVRIKGLSETGSTQLIAFLMQHATQQEISYRHEWKNLDAVFWDNRCTMHMAMNDYDDHLRILHRISVEGDIPF